MKFLIGSQNFGYDVETSDKDYAQVVFPTTKDLFENNRLSTTVEQPDGSCLKLIDIRDFPKLMHKSNFSDLQMLYSVEAYGEHVADFMWFCEYRERILRHNLPQLYSSNAGYIQQQLLHYKKSFGAYRHLVRAKSTLELLKLIASDKPLHTMRIDDLKRMRIHESPIEPASLLVELEELRDYFKTKEVDEEMKVMITDKCFNIFNKYLNTLEDK